MRAALRLLMVVAISCSAAGTSPAQERVTDLLGWVPAQTNLVLFVDAEALGNSAIAKKEKWGTSGDPVSGLDTLPPGVSRLVVASRFSPGSGANGEVFVARLKKPMTDADLLKATGGTQDKFAGKNVVLTPSNRFVVNLAPGIAGAYQPAERQDAARWLREATGKVPPNLSPLLATGGAGVGEATPVVLVLDTTDMFTPAVVKTKLAQCDTFKNHPANVDTAADLFGQLQHITLSIGASDKLTAEIKLEFGAAAAPLDGLAQPLMLEVVKRLGFHSAEMDQWTAAVQGKTVVFHGSLTKEGANDLLAPLLRPSLGTLAQAGPDVPADQLKMQASRKYFQAVQKKLDEVRKTNHPAYQKIVTVYGNAAKYIEELPLLNVDEELLDWGTATAAALRTMGVVLQSSHGAISATAANRALASVITPHTSVGGGYPAGYAWGGAAPGGSKGPAVVSNFAPTANIDRVTTQNWPLYREEVWRTVAAATLDLRRKLTKKYTVEF